MTQTDVAKAINDGLSALQAGNLQDALSHFQRGYKLDETNAAAQSLCGAVLVQLGRIEEGGVELLGAVKKNPAEPNLRVNLADYFLRAQNLPAARTELEKAISQREELPGAWERLGDIHFAESRLEDATRAYDKALSLDGSNFALALKLSRSLRAIKKFDGAEKALEFAETLRPGDASIAAARAELSLVKGEWKDLENQSNEILRNQPEDPVAWKNLATAFAETGRFGAASNALEKSLAYGERTPEALVHYAKICLNALDFERASTALDEAEKIDPQDPSVLGAKAMILTYQGHTKEAEEYCLRCLKVDPSNVEAFPQLSAIRNGRLTDDEEASVKSISRRDDLSPTIRSMAGFVLAHSYDARGEIDAAFAEYERANSLAVERGAREGLTFNRTGADAWTSLLIERFKGAKPLNEVQGDGVSPLFIVGLPRSGSTLVESVLAAHSQVIAGGEMPMLPPLFNNWMKARAADGGAVVSPDERRRFVNAYMIEAPTGDGVRFITDKNLLNLEAVGFIAQVFPKARIINVRRRPLESGLAIYRQDLPKFWTYANSLENIGRRYIQYARLAKHWEAAYGDRFLTVQYETFSRDFETEARALLNECGLDWEDACASFQSVRRTAATISAAPGP